jgi:methionyl-tRNA formyltransferase
VKIRRAVFVSRGKWGPPLLRWLKKQSCEIAYSDTENRPIETFPDYDLGIAFLYGHRIPLSEFDGRKRWVNFHSGPLPEFRGANLAYHAIMQRATHFGASIHYMDLNFDTGDLIEVQRFKIKPNYTAGDLVQRSHRLLLRLFRKYIPALLEGSVPSTPQSNGRYYRKSKLPTYVELTSDQELLVRALTVHPIFYARVMVEGRSYVILPEAKE